MDTQISAIESIPTLIPTIPEEKIIIYLQNKENAVIGEFFEDEYGTLDFNGKVTDAGGELVEFILESFQNRIKELVESGITRLTKDP
jgi:hypothetical protein